MVSPFLGGWAARVWPADLKRPPHVRPPITRPPFFVGVLFVFVRDVSCVAQESAVGFDTAVKVYSQLVGNTAIDGASARKYWYFMRLMGQVRGVGIYDTGVIGQGDAVSSRAVGHESPSVADETAVSQKVAAKMVVLTVTGH